MHDKIIGSILFDSPITLNCTKAQTITIVPQDIENEAKQENFTAELQLIDDSPVSVLQVDPQTSQAILLKMDQGYPLYPILKLVDCYLDRLTFDLIHKAYLDTVNAITNSPKKLLIQTKYQIEQLHGSLHFITKVLEIHKNSGITPNLLYLAEINFKLVKLCKKHTIVKKFKADLIVTYECSISGALELLIAMHSILKNWDLTETYCYQLLALLPTLKLRDQGNISKRYCDTYLSLSTVYLHFGHTKNAIKFLAKACDFVKKPQIDNFEQLIDCIRQMTQEIISHCREQADYLSALKTISLTKSTFAALNGKLSKLVPNDKILFLSWQNELNEASTQAEKEYFSGLQTAMANSPPTRSLLEKVQYDFKNGQLILFVKNLKETNATKHLKLVLKNLDIEIENSASHIIKANIYECTPDTLTQVCNNCLDIIRIEKEQREKRLQWQKEKYEREQPVRSLSQNSTEKEIGSSLTFFPLPKEHIDSTFNASAEPPVDKPYLPKRRKILLKEKEIHGETEPEVMTSKKSPSKITKYHWPNANRIYYANERNQGKVKMFSSEDSLSDIWFGYIHEALEKEPLYKQWDEKLVNGNLGYYSIRYISKELKKIQHNFTAKHPYKFKIVIADHNERLYGWIEEVIVDERGKRHYLVCFGYVDDHKIKCLPNPIAQKQMLDKVVGNVPEVFLNTI
jgi:hypothetical protein